MKPFPPFALAFRHDTATSPARIIARVAGSPVHVAVIFGDTVIEAVEGVGVRRVPTAARLAKGRWTVVPVVWGATVPALAFAESEMGQRYDWWGVLASWWAGRNGGNGHRDKWFCSEFAAAVLTAAGISLAVKRHAYYTPARLFRALKHWGTA